MANTPLAWITTGSSHVAQATTKQIINIEEQRAIDLGVGKGGQVWIVTDEAFEGDKEGNLAGNLLAFRKGKSWETVKGVGAVRVDASWQSDNSVVVLGDRSVARVDRKGKVEPLSEANFALDVSDGPDGTVWAVTTELEGTDNRIAYLRKDTKEWAFLENITGNRVTGRADGGAIVVYQGSAIIVNADGVQAGGLPMQPGSINQVSVAEDGTVWAITNLPASAGGNLIYYFDFDEHGNLTNIGVVDSHEGALRIDAAS